MDDTRDVTKNRQENVDEEICAAATLEEDAKRWQEDGEDDLDDVAETSLASFGCVMLGCNC